MSRKQPQKTCDTYSNEYIGHAQATSLDVAFQFLII